MTVLALDGGKNIGYALFTDTGEEIDRGVTDYRYFFSPYNDPYYNFFQVFDLDLGLGNHVAFQGYVISTIVVEGIMHNPMINQGGSQRWESQVEGAARMLGVIASVKVVVQRPGDALATTLMHEGLEWPKTKTGRKKHLPDDLAAWLHGRYYFRSIGVLE